MLNALVVLNHVVKDLLHFIAGGSMDISQALKRIDDESIQVFRRSVRVDFDHSREKPKAFYINHQIHEIVSAVGPFAGDLTENDRLYIVHTADQLTYVLHGVGREHRAVQKGEEPDSWTLDARILRDEELRVCHDISVTFNLILDG